MFLIFSPESPFSGQPDCEGSIPACVYPPVDLASHLREGAEVGEQTVEPQAGTGVLASAQGREKYRDSTLQERGQE